MCRLFGFHSNVFLKVHRSLVKAENALEKQSMAHPDGWGIGYFQDEMPVIFKSPMAASEDPKFLKASEFLSAQTVIAHVRKATVGQIKVENNHPFSYKNWLFAHNGNVENFALIKDRVRSMIRKDMLRYISGDTDSEHIFYLIMSELLGDKKWNEVKITTKKLTEAVARTVNFIESLDKLNSNEEKAITNILISNGEKFLVLRNGKDLFFSTQKNYCSDIDICSSVTKECILGVRHQAINHIIVSSEKLTKEDVWEQIEERDFLVVDKDMQLKTYSLSDFSSSLSFRVH